MNLFRLLLIAAAAWIVWRLIGGARGAALRSSREPPPATYEPMARCARCGTHLPAAALSRAGLCGRCSG